MKYYYYYIFFNAYWSSFDLGEKMIPRQNAALYMFLLHMFIANGIIFLINSFGVNFDLVILVIAAALAITLFNRIVLTEKTFNKLFKNYEFITEKSKRSRLTLFFVIIGVAGCINILGAMLFALNDV
ncbi:MAG: hypothetical protein OEX22_08465 [Cyclobacteriaceae bacterium]|nr:hypothetical protein [Cyclobacteriaceae bacterium]